MKRFIIADTHFGHENIIKYQNRPFKNVEEMDEQLIQNRNEIVSKGDLIFVLGDFTLENDKDSIKALVNKLNGRKVLIMGNHDTRKPKDYIDCGFEIVSKKPIMVEPGVILMHEPFEDPDLIASNYFYFYGHVHGTSTLMDNYENCVCASVERTNYKPANFDKFLRTLKREKSRKM